jgi:cyanophycinase
MKHFIFLSMIIGLAGYLPAVAQPSPITVKKSATRHGPEKGSLIIIGGGGSTPAIWKKFIELAGGAEKGKVVFISLTDPRLDTGSRHSYAEIIKKETGIRDVTVLYTADVSEANSDKFIAPLKQATGVFFDGGRQWHFADSYLNTRTHQALIDVLNRGGVIAGSSAGATILGSFLWRGDTRGPEILIGDHTQGLGFLKNSVIDQHLLARNRQFAMVDFIRETPELFGVGLDQATAILVQRDTLEVLGKSYVAIYDYNTIIGNGVKHVAGSREVLTASSGPFFFLHEGERYDMANRKVLDPVGGRGRAVADGEDGDGGVVGDEARSGGKKDGGPGPLSPIRINDSLTKYGPAKGSLLIIGGNVGSDSAIWAKFTALAGGREKAVIVVITTASGDSAAFDQRDVETVKKQTGVKNVTLLHTNDLKEANSEQFIAPLTRATAVYFVGGRQWRLADSYLNTLTHKALWDVLERGGVIAGSSAGASIQGSFLWRGDTHGAHILVGDHVQGLGFLKNSAIDQHLLRRNRQFDILELIRNSPKLIGLGLDEATAVFVHQDTLEVLGKSYVAIYDYNTIIGNGEKHVQGDREIHTASDGPFFFLSSGQKYDLRNRKVIPAVRRRPGGVAPVPE